MKREDSSTDEDEINTDAPGRDDTGRNSLVYVRCSEVVVDRRRRRELPSTATLSGHSSPASLLQPIAITPDFRLITGQRRLLDAMRAGEEYIAAIVVHTLRGQYDMLLAKVLENGEQPTYAEMADLADMLLPLAQEAARRRRAHRAAQPGGTDSLNEAGTALDRVAALFNLSRPTLCKIRKIVTAARTDSAQFGDLLEAMDADRKVDRAYNELLRRKGINRSRPHSQPGIDGVDLHVDRKGNFSIRICAHRSDVIAHLKTYIAEIIDEKPECQC